MDMKNLKIKNDEHTIELQLSLNGSPYLSSVAKESFISTPLTLAQARRMHAWLGKYLAEQSKTGRVVLDSVKDPDVWPELIETLGLSEAAARKHFDFSEYASLEIEVDSKLRIVGGRILPRDA